MDACTNAAAHQDSCTFAHMDPHLSAFDSHAHPDREDAYGHLDTATNTWADVDTHPDTDSALFASHLVAALHRTAGRHSVPSGGTSRYKP